MYFVTNSPVKTRTELQQDATKRGFNITENQIISASYATAKYLHDLNFTKKVYLIGHGAIVAELNAFGIECVEPQQSIQGRSLYDMIVNGVQLDESVGAVVISFDANFTYSKLFEASNYAKRPECIFLATSFDESYPTKDGGVIPLIGPLVAAIETASGRSPTIVGKPSSIMYQTLLQNGHAIHPKSTLMVGDALKYDILFGYNCGLQTLLVGTGLNSISDVAVLEDKKLMPDTYLANGVADLLSLLIG